MYTENILDLIGNTPLIGLKKMTGCSIFGKAEFLNPGGSIKDRAALNMIVEAEKKGTLKPGMTIVEPTSGNTGIGLALAGVQKGYHVVIVMPENMSEERKQIIRLLGAELVLTPKEESVDGAVKVATRLSKQDGYFLPQQFENPDNPAVHYKYTAPELYRQMDEKIDIFVAGLGSGGTLQGFAKYLKEVSPSVKIVAVEPLNVSALNGDTAGFHSIQGIGDGFIPKILDTGLIDEVIEVSDEDAIQTTRKLATIQGLMCGISSGANVFASILCAEKYGENLRIGTVLPDRMERYFSTGLLI